MVDTTKKNNVIEQLDFVTSVINNNKFEKLFFKRLIKVVKARVECRNEMDRDTKINDLVDIRNQMLAYEKNFDEKNFINLFSFLDKKAMEIRKEL